MDPLPLPPMLTPAELGRMLHVGAKTVSRWEKEGKLNAVRTPGGHRRFPLPVVLSFLGQMGFDEEAAVAAIRAVGQ